MLKITCIADIHFGKLNDDDRLYDELKNGFIKHCNENKPDIIVICGDSYDSRQLINSKANINYQKFIDDCRDTGAIIIVIEGTESHDRYQINSLLHYSSDRFFIINTVTKLNILGMKFLIVPEEYVKDSSYYDEYLNDTYDFVFGHGMASHVGFSDKSVSDEIMKKPFIWEAKELEKICKNYTVFGHIHTHSEYHNFIYCGSYSRLNFGEMEAKGFIDLIETKKGWKYEFIENKQAPTFTDIFMTKLPNDIDSLLNQLRGYQENSDYLRIVIDQDDENKSNTIKGFVKNHDNCCIKQAIKKKTDEKEISDNIQEQQALLSSRMDKYKGLSFMEITLKIAKDEYHTDFTQEEVNSILNTQI